MTPAKLTQALKCPGPSRTDSTDASVRSDRCGGPLAPRPDADGYRCERCQRNFDSVREVPRLVVDADESEYVDAANLATYHEMHFAAFVSSDDAAPPTVTRASGGPAFHAAELHRASALTECFYQEICSVIDEGVGSLTGSLALDIACATGRMSAELAVRGACVLGVDLSEPFVTEARRILFESHGQPKLGFARYGSGLRRVQAVLPWELGSDNVLFAIADATRLPIDDATADLVLVLNLIDRVPDPSAVLVEAWRCVTPGGCLLHADPFDYRESSTPDEEKRIYDLDGLLGQWGGELALKRNVAFPVRRAWSRVVQTYIDEVSLYRKA